LWIFRDKNRSLKSAIFNYFQKFLRDLFSITNGPSLGEIGTRKKAVVTNITPSCQSCVVDVTDIYIIYSSLQHRENACIILIFRKILIFQIFDILKIFAFFKNLGFFEKCLFFRRIEWRFQYIWMRKMERCLYKIGMRKMSGVSYLCIWKICNIKDMYDITFFAFSTISL